MQAAKDPQAEDVMLRSMVRGMHVLMVVAALIAAAGVAFSATGELRRYIGSGMVLAIVAISHWQSGISLRRSVIVIVVGIWAMTGITAAMLSGVHAGSNIIYPFCIALAGWVLGRRWLVGMTVATMVVLIGLAVAEHFGAWLPAARAKPVLVAAQSCAILMVVSYMAWSARRMLGESRDRAQLASRELAAQNDELVRSREETDRLMKNMPAAVATFDAQSRLVRCNQRYSVLFAARPEEIIGKHIAEYVPQVAIDQLDTYWKAALAGTPQNYRRFNVDPRSHQVTWVDSALMPVFHDGAVVGLDAVLMDVTDKVQAEAELKSLNMELEQKVENRTRALLEARERLEESHDDLLRAQGSASLVAMIAGVSHELGTPVGNSRLAVSSSKEILGEFSRKFESGQLTKSDLQAFLSELNEGNRILESNLVRTERLLQSFRQVSADQASEQRRTFDLSETVAEVVGSMAPMLKRKPHRLVVDIPQGIVLDSLPGPLGQVFINLINNAYLHAFDGKEPGVLSITAQRVEPESVLIRVDDDGIGMSAEVVARLFEPFFSTRIGSGGTGLGMGIVKRIVERMLGGHIDVESAPGAGTRFAIRLPLQAPHTHADA
jgi:PAS domain S-box-containing protein